MGNQSASRRQGDRFQDLYCWYEILRLLKKDSPYEYAWIEHPQAGSADDLTLHPRAGLGVPTRYVQIKWHVDHRETISFESLAESKSGRKSILLSLFESWRFLKQEGPVELCLVTNWSANPLLGRLLDARSNSFKEDLFSGKPEEARALHIWQTALAAGPDELVDFCRSLRLRTGYHSISDLEQCIQDLMQLCKLRSGENARAIARDLLSVLIERGGESKRLDRDKLRTLISDRDLWETEGVLAPAGYLKDGRQAEPDTRLWIHGWAKRAYAEPPEVELDWTTHFSRAERRIPNQKIWERDLFPELAEKRRVLAHEGKTFIDFRARVPLTTTLAVGYAFPEVDNFTFRIEQPVAGEVFLWSSNAQRTDRFFRLAEEKREAGGNDVLVVFSVTGDSSGAVQGLLNRLRPNLTAFFHAMPDGGPGGTAIRSAGDATALAQEAKELLRRIHNQFPASRKHLVVYSPAVFSLFLGQKLNALGDVLTYEMTGEGNDYQPSVLLRTN